VQAGAIMVAQWGDGKGPVSPWARVLLTASDIALEYVSVDPDILGGNGSGEKILKAYARNLAELLPDDGRFGVKEGFAEQLAGVFLRAGLSTLSAHPEWVVSEDHLQQLISASIKPLLQEQVFPADITTRIRWREVSDTFMGPAAAAALRTIAERPGSFLGDDFAADQGLGALIRALFLEAAERSPNDRFSEEGLLALFKAAAAAAAASPNLFVNDGGEPEDAVARALFKDMLAAVADVEPPLNRSVAIALGAAALESVGGNAHRFAAAGRPWQAAAADGTRLLLSELAQAFSANQGLQQVLSRAMLIELGRIVLTRMAAAPQMAAVADEAWIGVIKAVAIAMAADEQLLLGRDDWRAIVAVASDVAAKNPARLFRIDPADPAAVLAGRLMALVLRAAGDAIENEPTRAGAVLFGATLREAIIILVQTCSEHAQSATDRINQIETLVRDLNSLVSTQPMHLGSQAWISLFAILLDRLLSGDPLPALDAQTAQTLLRENAA
jgi:hypothetical protein